jgi:hypothetical protein
MVIFVVNHGPLVVSSVMLSCQWHSAIWSGCLSGDLFFDYAVLESMCFLAGDWLGCIRCVARGCGEEKSAPLVVC